MSNHADNIWGNQQRNMQMQRWWNEDSREAPWNPLGHLGRSRHLAAADAWPLAKLNRRDLHPDKLGTRETK
jgi:hypothetical protein